ncbi:MAG: bifunctional methylenetetrahydrofolate dehydrogenase/methenyltetrahydrofolate cyclohydrolase FolD, partial [Clostridia bacterium]|nr:bifunctional methylenetetrahydrofolate dehydrogenase/methenyltetrahydrofolate cyclohydrolase FolD [Clostridia bacterium]
MMAHIIDGKKIAELTRADIAARVEAFHKENGILPGLAVVIVGENPASKVYVRNKKKASEEAGMYSVVCEMPEGTTQEEMMAKLQELKDDRRIHGILVQLPLPAHLDEGEVLRFIPPEKDVDAFHAENTGHIMIGDYQFLPCTPAGVMELIKESGIDVKGKECVVVGRSNIVGKPMTMLLLHEHGTVTVCHSKTRDLKEVTLRADILVVAVGVPELIRGDMVKEGAVVIDVGMNRLPDKRLVGDVCFPEASEKAFAITPVPGGVGPMTIAMLMKNTV